MLDPSYEVEILGPDGVTVGAVRPFPPPPQRVWLHVLLLGLTLVTTTFFGGLWFANVPAEVRGGSFFHLLTHPAFVTGAISFSLPLMAILPAHEMGHYLALPGSDGRVFGLKHAELGGSFARYLRRLAASLDA